MLHCSCSSLTYSCKEMFVLLDLIQDRLNSYFRSTFDLQVDPSIYFEAQVNVDMLMHVV